MVLAPHPLEIRLFFDFERLKLDRDALASLASVRRSLNIASKRVSEHIGDPSSVRSIKLASMIAHSSNNQRKEMRKTAFAQNWLTPDVPSCLPHCSSRSCKARAGGDHCLRELASSPWQARLNKQ